MFGGDVEFAKPSFHSEGGISQLEVEDINIRMGSHRQGALMVLYGVRRTVRDNVDEYVAQYCGPM